MCIERGISISLEIEEVGDISLSDRFGVNVSMTVGKSSSYRWGEYADSGEECGEGVERPVWFMEVSTEGLGYERVVEDDIEVREGEGR